METFDRQPVVTYSGLPSARHQQAGFTLIELSIVLVIIGLLVGGVLVGRDLIHAAEIRSQISQIEKYNTAVNTFLVKYNCLPGDCSNAAEYGFAARGAYAGEGDGNGVIEGNFMHGFGQNYGNQEISGETVMFWADLTVANLIDGTFTTASSTVFVASVTGSSIGNYFPTAKIGGGNYVYVYSGGYQSGACGSGCSGDGLNYYGLSVVNQIGNTYPGCISSTPGLTVQDAYNIDQKIDDGYPQSGSVTALYLNWAPNWAAGPVTPGSSAPAPYTTATSSSSTSCFDNNDTGGATQHYSTEVNNGTGINCALSFRFQ